ncbi:hypothetical protein UFOVP1246_19 [uncultured Caudovirales phage]|uniref:Uncharacterized protein n=1 Tax=uncultured Caudovirales phage TaxID=2100421 RepID=A0A6J5R7U5_9CAUD|nr:hypothetical protein UFOVP1246_19 [uncultured Caudovirales phage]
MFDPPQPPPPPPAPEPKPSIFSLFKVRAGIVMMLVIIGAGLFSNTNKEEPPKASIPLTPTTVKSDFTLTDTQSWLLVHQESISKYLNDAGVYSSAIASDTTPSSMMSDCSAMLTMVDDYYYAPWKTELGAPSSWIRLLNLMHDGLTYCAAGDFTRGGQAVEKASEEQGNFTADIKAATP